ncbi:Bug family tripartite tricarboxylate transporter substrate binding protein [Bradyrhizobium cenepequi]|uniref:Bug family tripartite tricarboxylate transporter substrate binding protein n=1 Tax=Bradyrhizobium cenepequi TaxID=2821403 RepID=UPI001CE2B119|nr:tripartite tricarboxylate transporter substrate binding protein [Bradyrhizobium cenepequi]MCA6112946.1 tripartite tricarboxylate transporter substrate binding protein [Bradyrhizobium cenepequi]
MGKRVYAAVALGLLAALAPIAARADDAAGYPSRQIRIVVPFPAGGTADSLPRILAEKLRQKWSQPVIIDNRSGAGGNIGAEAVASSPPDGYTLLASPPGPIAINQSLYAKLAYDPSELKPVALIGTSPNVLDVRPGFPAKTVRELIDYAKANPGKVTFASQGNGSTSHLTTVLFQKLTGTQMVHVPYRGTAPALQDIMGNNVDLFFDNLGSSLALHVGGALRILGVAGPGRAPSLPDVPTIKEAGFPDFASVTWFALMAPKGTPDDVIAKLNATVGDLLRETDVKDQFDKLGVQVEDMDVQALTNFIASERVRWGDIIKSANVTVD